MTEFAGCLFWAYCVSGRAGVGDYILPQNMTEKAPLALQMCKIQSGEATFLYNAAVKCARLGLQRLFFI